MIFAERFWNQAAVIFKLDSSDAAPKLLVFLSADAVSRACALEMDTNLRED